MVSASQVSRLKLASQGAAFTWLLLKVPDGRRIAAVPVLKKRGGILLAIPLLALTEEELAQKAIAGVTDDLAIPRPALCGGSRPTTWRKATTWRRKLSC